MTGAERIIEELRELVEGTATDIRMLQYIRRVVHESTRLADTMGIDRPSQAFALTAVACAIADEAGTRAAVMEALHRCWPELFHEVSEKTMERMEELARRDGQ